jgi:hypothetical protein
MTDPMFKMFINGLRGKIYPKDFKFFGGDIANLKRPLILIRGVICLKTEKGDIHLTEYTGEISQIAIERSVEFSRNVLFKEVPEILEIVSLNNCVVLHLTEEDREFFYPEAEPTAMEKFNFIKENEILEELHNAEILNLVKISKYEVKFIRNLVFKKGKGFSLKIFFKAIL